VDLKPIRGLDASARTLIDCKLSAILSSWTLRAGFVFDYLLFMWFKFSKEGRLFETFSRNPVEELVWILSACGLRRLEAADH
jgi:hypothetical protein